MVPVYMDNILSYVSDKSTEVKKLVVGFIEELRWVWNNDLLVNCTWVTTKLKSLSLEPILQIAMCKPKFLAVIYQETVSVDRSYQYDLITE